MGFRTLRFAPASTWLATWLAYTSLACGTSGETGSGTGGSPAGGSSSGGGGGTTAAPMGGGGSGAAGGMPSGVAGGVPTGGMPSGAGGGSPSAGAPGAGTAGMGGASAGTGGSAGAAGTGGSGGGVSKDCVAMVDAAKSFLAGLDASQKTTASYGWADAAQRKKFEFVPPGNATPGLTLKKLSAQQSAAFKAFLSSAMSVPGYMKIDAIRQLELVLRAQENADPNYRDPENYFISFFGDPNTALDQPWGWRFEGHHVSVHSSVLGCKEFAATPAFWGASGFGGQNPNPLNDSVQAAKALFDSLSGDAKTAASTGPEGQAGILAKQAKISPYEVVGVAGAQLSAPQLLQLRALINTYVGNMAKPIAENRLKAIEDAGIGEVRFLYKGGYFRVQGPTFLIEYAPQSATHVHSIWRDFQGDWGDDLLQKHLREKH